MPRAGRAGRPAAVGPAPVVQARRRVSELGPQNVVPCAHAAGSGGAQMRPGAGVAVEACHAATQHGVPCRAAREAGKQDVVEVQLCHLSRGLADQRCALAPLHGLPEGSVAGCCERRILLRGDQGLVEGKRDGCVAVHFLICNPITNCISLRACVIR